MKVIVLRDIRQFFTGEIFFLLFVCFFFGYAERQNTLLSYEQFVLKMITDHYYIIYFMVPLFLFFTYKSLEDKIDYVLIRTRYYWQYFLAKALSFLLNMISFVGLQFIIMMLLGIGLRRDNTFVLAGGNYYGIEELFIEYAKYFNTPLIASITAGVYMIIGLTVLSIVFLLIHHFFENKTTAIVMITLYFFIVLGFKMPILNRIPFLFMNNYIILHHNFTASGKIMMSLISMLIILIVTGILVKYFWKKRPKWSLKLKKRGIAFYYTRYLFTKRNIAILFAILFFISLWKVVNVSFEEGAIAGDFFLSMFYGHGVKAFNMISFIEMLVLNGGPLYLLSIFVETIHNEQNLGLTIRMKHKRNWTRAILQIAVVFITLYVALMIGVGIVLSMMNDLPVDGLTVFLIQLSLLKFLDLLFQFLAFFMLFIWKRNVTMAFLIVLGSNVISILPMTWVIYFPTGLSSMARNTLILDQEGVTFQMALVILGSCVLLQWVYIKFHGYKKVLGG